MTAIQLARRGVAVEVFERSSERAAPQRIRCDAVENWTAAEDLGSLLSSWGLDATPFRKPPSIEVRTFRGECHTLGQAHPLLYLVKRGGEAGCLDHALKMQALDLGVRIRHGQTLPRHQADVWAVGSRRGRFFLDVGLTFRTSQPDRVVILFDTGLAPRACAYLIVIDGVGTLAVLLTEQFKLARRFLSDTVAAFQRVQPFELRDARLHAGFGGALDVVRPGPRGPLVVGEAAGFLDYLWGFGIRHAMLSCVLAARALREGADYEELVAREIRPLVQSSLINRIFYNRAGNRVYGALIRYLCARRDVHGLLRRAYRFRTVRKAFWPWVARSLTPGSP